MPATLEYTVCHWPEGYYTRRVSYYLLIKGLVSSSADLLAGKSNAPNLRISLSVFDNDTHSLHPPDPLDAKPVDKSLPSLQVLDTSTGRTSWVRESSSIPLYLEDAYPNAPFLAPQTPLERAQMYDLLSLLASAEAEGYVYLRHAHPLACKFWGVADGDRNLGAARNGKKQMISKLKKLQEWGKETLDLTGWLTPGLDGPGLVDVQLAVWARFQELGYDTDLFEDEGLGELKEWYTRFKGLEWWIGLEERQGSIPEGMKYGKGEI